MGEMADWIINQGIDRGWCPWGGGKYKKSNYPPLEPVTKSCSKCGEEALVWQKYQGKWRLYDLLGVIHECKKKQIKIGKVKEN